MAHIHKSNSYNPGNIPNPFHEGQDRAYADILLDKMNEMKWWRGIIGVGIIFLFAVSLFLFWYAVSLQKTIPVLVNVMPSGEAAYLGEVKDNGALQIPEAAILYQVRKFITNVRSVSIDPQVLYNNINECYSMVTSAYEPIFTRMLRSASPFDLVGKIRRTVEIESTLRVTGNSYQVDWTESTIEAGGTARNIKIRALVTVTLLPPGPAFIRTNPLGIFIENYEWTEL